MSVLDNEGQVAARIERRATTPVAGATAGVLFAVLFGVSVTIMVTTMGRPAQDTGAWLQGDLERFRLAVGLMPFAGLFFLWFIAVARQRLGQYEDQFFATVFLGSGLLFLAMVFAATASVGAMVATYALVPTRFVGSASFVYSRTLVAQIFNVYALRMAAVFMFSQATLWLRTGVMPKWLAAITVVTALALLVVVTQSVWAVLAFPAWVLLVSCYILVTHFTGSRVASR